MKIFGFGLAGGLAGCLFPQARIFEAGPAGQANHKAVLRFRSAAVGDALGIDFRKVTVRKGLAIDGEFVAPTIQRANWYAMKTVGRLVDRSIWNLETVERYIAPEDFLAQLAERCNGRVEWNHTVTAADLATNGAEPVISTLPMSVLARMIGASAAPTFAYAPITVRRWRVPDADVFQSIYYPQLDTPLYRASITGSLLIAEFATADLSPGVADAALQQITACFGLHSAVLEQIETTSQRYGKIAPLANEGWRKDFIFKLTHERNIFSLGRFATWRNLLLDDVLRDITVIKKLLNATAYDRRRASA